MMECQGVGLRRLFGDEVIDNPLEFIFLKHEIFRKYSKTLVGPNFLHALPPMIFFATAITIIYKLLQFRRIHLSSYLKLSWLPFLVVASWITSVLNFTMGICYHESLYCFVYKSHKEMVGVQQNQGYSRFIWKTSPETATNIHLSTAETAALTFSILISVFELMIAQSPLLPWMFGKITTAVETVCCIVMSVISISYQKWSFARHNVQSMFIEKSNTGPAKDFFDETGSQNQNKQKRDILAAGSDEQVASDANHSEEESEFGSSSSKIYGE